MTATIGLLGDVMLGRSVARELARRRPETVWSDEVVRICIDCDAVVCNLECCISERGTPTERIPGKPFFFRAPPAAVDALRAAGVVAASLANNHALDYEESALLDTLGQLSAAGIAPVGAGADADAARRGCVIRAGGLRVGLVAATDHPAEYTAAHDAPGVAWANLQAGLPDWLREEIERLDGEADVVIAFVHWGPNMSTRPARWQRQRAGEIVAAGADLVAGHSAHVFHGIEVVDRSPVLYDLGDALDDYRVDPKLRNDLGILALWRPGGDPDLELVGLRLDFCATTVARGPDAEWIAARVEEACAELGTGVERVEEARLVVAA